MINDEFPFDDIYEFMQRVLETDWQANEGFRIFSCNRIVELHFPVEDLETLSSRCLNLLVHPRYARLFASLIATRYIHLIRPYALISMAFVHEKGFGDDPEISLYPYKNEFRVSYPVEYIHAIEAENYSLNLSLEMEMDRERLSEEYTTRPKKIKLEDLEKVLKEEPEPEETPQKEPKVRMSSDIKDWLEDHPAPLNPRQINAFLEERGYFGQEEARQTVCTFIYRHLHRVRQWKETGTLSRLPPKPNLLLSGPTGCGKTFLLELIFKELLELPMVIVDCSSLTETGFVGKSVYSITRALHDAADFKPGLAEIGMVILDEFDKLASYMGGEMQSSVIHDVKGFGVQRELLKLIEGAETDYRDSGKMNGVKLSTRMVPFVGAGVFSNFDSVKRRLQKTASPLGFGNPSGDRELIGSDPGHTRVLEGCGFLPELIGRFTNFARLDPLPEPVLKQILHQNVYSRYQAECAADGISLNIEPEVLTHVLNESIAKNLGARGLGQSLHQYMEKALYEGFGSEEPLSLTLYLEQGRIQYDLSPQHATACSA